MRAPETDSAKPFPTDCRGLDSAQLLSLNRTCECVSLPSAQDARYLSALDLHEDSTSTERQNLFASTAVFVSQTEMAAMQRQIDAIESVSALPGYRHEIAQRANTPVDSVQANTRGLFMGYDFHLTEDGPRLIEVNTNAGGAFVMHAMLKTVWQRVSPCNAETLDHPASIEHRISSMFTREWQLAGRQGKPATVAIVDHNPAAQYLYPDMLLAKAMLERSGISVVIATTEELSINNGKLFCNNQVIDMVYNRSTDFALTDSAQVILRRALEQNLAVVSPAPAHHALFADKRNPLIWRNTRRMQSYGAADSVTATLAELPRTESVTQDQEAAFWNQRKSLFFKPSAGFGSKAAYRGSKLTRKVWAQIIQGGYIAQSFQPPALRSVGEGDHQSLMKFDLRIYTFGGQPLLAAARVYQGQTTNFRTPGGGFAPVIYLE